MDPIKKELITTLNKGNVSEVCKAINFIFTYWLDDEELLLETLNCLLFDTRKTIRETYLNLQDSKVKSKISAYVEQHPVLLPRPLTTKKNIKLAANYFSFVAYFCKSGSQMEVPAKNLAKQIAAQNVDLDQEMIICYLQFVAAFRTEELDRLFFEIFKKYPLTLQDQAGMFIRSSFNEEFLKLISSQAAQMTEKNISFFLDNLDTIDSHLKCVFISGIAKNPALDGNLHPRYFEILAQEMRSDLWEGDLLSVFLIGHSDTLGKYFLNQYNITKYYPEILFDIFLFQKYTFLLPKILKCIDVIKTKDYLSIAKLAKMSGESHTIEAFSKHLKQMIERKHHAAFHIPKEEYVANYEIASSLVFLHGEQILPFLDKYKTFSDKRINPSVCAAINSITPHQIDIEEMIINGYGMVIDDFPHSMLDFHNFQTAIEKRKTPTYFGFRIDVLERMSLDQLNQNQGFILQDFFDHFGNSPYWGKILHYLLSSPFSSVLSLVGILNLTQPSYYLEHLELNEPEFTQLFVNVLNRFPKHEVAKRLLEMNILMNTRERINIFVAYFQEYLFEDSELLKRMKDYCLREKESYLIQALLAHPFSNSEEILFDHLEEGRGITIYSLYKDNTTFFYPIFDYELTPYGHTKMLENLLENRFFVEIVDYFSRYSCKIDQAEIVFEQFWENNKNKNHYFSNYDPRNRDNLFKALSLCPNGKKLARILAYQYL